MNEQSTTFKATPEHWAGLIDLVLIFIAAATWEPITIGLVAVALILRRVPIMGRGICLLLNVEQAPAWLRFALPSTTAAIMSTPSDQADQNEAVAAPVAKENETPLQGIAELNNDFKEVLRVAVEAAKVEALALLILESNKKAFQNGKVPETRGLHALFGVTQTSDPGSEYQRLRALLKKQLEQIDPNEKNKDGIIGIGKNGRTIRKDSAGNFYYIDDQGVRQNIDI